MPKPPATPPSSDIDGTDEDRHDRLSKESFDGKAKAQMAAEARENIGRPETMDEDELRRDPNVGVGN